MFAITYRDRERYEDDPASADADHLLEASLFGIPSFRYRDGELRLGLPRHSLRLLAYLLLERGVQPRERVAFALWPDDDEPAARANLRRHLHLVQRALPKSAIPWLLADTTSVGWNVAAPVRLDVARFEEACSSAASFASAIDLYRGALLSGWDDDWVVARRERAHTLAVTALTALVSATRAQGDTQRALAYAQRLRALDPWREDAVRALIGLRYECGDRAGALAEYERFAVALADELGVEPMPETQSVYEALLRDRGLVAASLDATEREQQTDRRGVLPFVGRAVERARLEDAWSRVRTGNGETILVTGDAGVGKTRLLEEFASEVVARGGRALIGRTTSIESVPFQAFADALRSALPLVRSVAVDPLRLGMVCALVPQLRVERPELPEPTALSAPRERSCLYEAVAHTLRALADVRPVLLILEDLHWAGDSTLALLEYVARRVPSSRVLLVATYREDAAPRRHALRDLRRRLETERLARPLAIGTLELQAIEELLGHVLDETPQRRAEIAAALHRRSDGNALFLHETLRACAASGVFDGERRCWNGDVASSRMPIPETISAWLLQRIERLPSHVRTVAEVSAVAGPAFSLELVRDVSGLDERCVLDAFDRLIDERMVRDAGGRADFAFTRDVVRGAVYDALPEPVRRRRHRRVATVLEQLYPERADELAIELAQHYDAGDEPQRAACCYARAAVQASTAFANHEAIAHVRRGLELSDDPFLRKELLALAEALYARLGQRVPQRAALARLVGLTARLGDAEALADALHRRVELERACGDREAEREALADLAAAVRRP